MKNKFIKLLALTLCAFMLFSSMTGLMASAADDDEVTWDDIWEATVKPAYMNTAFSSVKERILGSGEIEPMDLLTVIDGYAFYGDTLTGEMIFLVLKDKTLTKEDIVESGSIPEYTAFYCTNPYNAGAARAKNQTQGTDASEKQKLLSQIIIKYSKSDKDSQMSSFADAAARQQITVKNIRGGVRVEYTIGREQVTYLVPRVIRAEKFDALYTQISEGSAYLAERFKAFYVLNDLNSSTLSDKSKKEMETNYPITKQFAIYVCEPTISSQELLKLEKYVKTYTDYDYDTLEADHSETDYVASDDVPPLFKLALEYKVDGEQITIRCNAGNIRFDSSVYKLSDVLVLPYGGAGDVNNSGYIFSPDGSGSLISFDDLSGQFTNTSSLYGQDYAYHTITGANSEVARLPVFGVYQRVEKDSKKEEVKEVLDENGQPVYDEDGNVVTETVLVDVPLEIAYLAVIEEGDSLAKINISYGGPVHNYASIYTSFNPRPKDSYVLDGGLSVGTNAMWTVESKRKYTGDFKLRLFILDGTEDGDEATALYDADKSYSDMAAAYREYLKNTGVLTEIDNSGDANVPLYLETLGALETTKSILGVPVLSTIALTSFQDTIDILSGLKDNGEDSITNIKVKMQGWYNDGLMPDIATSIDVEKVLGGEEGFKQLIDYANQNGFTIFPDIELSLAYNDGTFDGFDTYEDLSESIDERPSVRQDYDPATQSFIKTGEGIISPSFMNELYDSANEDYSKFNVGAISVGTLGKYLSSDFDPDNPLSREDSKELIVQLLEKIKNNGNNKLLVTAGNKYTLPYATDILEVPLDDSRLLYSYATVPFMSMVLHGYKEYAGNALNLAGDYDYYLLKTIESGASPYFVIAANNTSELKQYQYTAVDKYYSVRYNIWKDDIIAAYNAVNDALTDVKYSAIRKHEILSEDGKVAKVTYYNDVVFYVNYGEKAYSVEGTDIVVPVNGYVKVTANGEAITWEGV